MLFAIPLAILKITGSIKYSGLAFAVEWLPRLLLFPISGSIADHLNPKRIFFLVDAVRALIILTASFFIFRNSGNIFLILAVTMALLSIGQSLAFVAFEATLPRELPPEELPKAHSLLQGIDQVSQIVGPALAVFASQYLELTWVIVAGAVLFLFSSFNALGISVSYATPAKKPLNVRELCASYKFAWNILLKNPILLQLCGLTWVVNLVYAAALVASPAMVMNVFHLSTAHFGLLQTFAGCASVFVFFTVPFFTRKYGLPKLGLLAMAAMLLSGLILSLAELSTYGFLVYSLGYISLMGMDGAFNVYIRSLRGQIIPKEHLGKVIGLIILINNSSLPLVGIGIAKLSDHLNPSEALGSIFILSLMLAGFLLIIGRRAIGYSTLAPSLNYKL